MILPVFVESSEDTMSNNSIREFLGSFLKVEFFRFVIVGVLATAIHYGLYYVLLRVLNVNIAYSIGYIVSLICNFFLSARYTFKSQVSVKKGVGFVCSHLINYLLHIGFLNLFLFIGVSKEVAPVPVFCCVFPINFLLVRTVFKAKWFQR